MDNVMRSKQQPFFKKDLQKLSKGPTCKKVMRDTNNINTALRTASHERLMELESKLANADKSVLSEKWFKDWFTYRGEDVIKQVILGAEHGIKFNTTRKIDTYEDHFSREMKNISTTLGKEGKEQLADQINRILKDVKVNDAIIGYDLVRRVFLNPEGARIFSIWMITQLKKYPDNSLSFQLMNKYAKPYAISTSSLSKLGETKLREEILNWVTGLRLVALVI